MRHVKKRGIKAKREKKHREAFYECRRKHHNKPTRKKGDEQ
jgi:hypothetical protein